MATAKQLGRRNEWATPIKFGAVEEATPVSLGTSGWEAFSNTNLLVGSLHLKTGTVVVAMQTASPKQKTEQADISTIIRDIVAQIQEEFSRVPLVSRVYYAITEEMKEVYIIVVMDSLDYDTEKELTKFFIRQEDRFPNIRLQTRFPVLSDEEAEEIYLKEGSFEPCYNRDK